MEKSFSCIKCRNQISVVRNNLSVRCPKCNYINVNPKNEAWKRIQSRIREFRVEWMHKIAGTHYPRDVLTLNCSPSPLVSSSATRPRKRALLCGVGYRWSKEMLMGPVADVLNMKDLLVNIFSFLEDSILILTDAEASPELKPTRKNIETGLQWLVQDCSSGDSLFFYFSGHGAKEVDEEGDEVDGFNEAICPLDYKHNGIILDNQINSTIVRPLKQGVTLHAIIDTCYSGTVLDLTSVYNAERNQWVDEFPPNGAYKGTSGGLAICISACKDDQKTNTSLPFKGKSATGALTHSFVQAIKNKPRLTYAGLITSLQDAIEESRKLQARNIIGRFFPNSSQEVQLSSSEKFNISSREFRL